MKASTPKASTSPTTAVSAPATSKCRGSDRKCHYQKGSAYHSVFDHDIFSTTGSWNSFGAPEFQNIGVIKNSLVDR
jgi:hypothetical protein